MVCSLIHGCSRYLKMPNVIYSILPTIKFQLIENPDIHLNILQHTNIIYCFSLNFLFTISRKNIRWITHILKTSDSHLMSEIMMHCSSICALWFYKHFHCINFYLGYMYCVSIAALCFTLIILP